MGTEDTADSLKALHELNGAVEALWSLREEFAQWLEEAQDESKQEALDNVLAHVDAVSQQYRLRRDEARKRLSAD